MGLLGDAWTVLVLRDVARGCTRFEQLLAESGISRKVLAARLRALEEAEVLVRVAYQDRPVRHDYLLTERGRALLPVLAGLQEWGDTWLLGGRYDERHRGAVQRGGPAGGRARGHAPCHRSPTTHSSRRRTPSSTATPAPRWLASTRCPAGRAARWSRAPTATGCTTSRRSGARVVGVSTQLPGEQAAFAAANRIQFPLVSDADLASDHGAAAADLPAPRRHPAQAADPGRRRGAGGARDAVPDPRRHRQCGRRAGAGAVSPARGESRARLSRMVTGRPPGRRWTGGSGRRGRCGARTPRPCARGSSAA